MQNESLFPQEYRAKELAVFKEIEDVITENYEAFWKVAEVIHKHNEPIRIETPFGDFLINPKLMEPEWLKSNKI